MTRLAWELADAGDSVTLLTAGDPSLPRKERRGGLEIVRVGRPRLMSPLVWALELTSLHRRYDVVVEEAMGGERAPFFGRFLSGSPTVGFWYQDNRDLISLMYGGVGATLGGWLQELLLRAGREGYALGNSRATTDWLVSRGFHRGQVAESLPFIVRYNAPERTRPFSERRNLMVSIGNFRPTKRFEEAVTVVDHVRDQVPDAELVLLGRAQDPEYLARLRRLVSERGLGGSVQIRVDVSDAEKFRVLSEAKVLTVHSPIEGFGWTVVEAGECGVPTVGNAGVSTDALRDGVNGRRLEFGRTDAYAGEIVRLFRDAAYWGMLSEGARAVASEFTAGVVTPQVKNLLVRCAGSRARASA